MNYLNLFASVASETAAAGESPVLTGIAGTVMVIITTLVTLIAKWLRSKYQSETQQHQIDSTKSLMEQRNFIIDQRLIPFAIDTAEHFLITQLPTIVKDATDGGGFDWKLHWSNLSTYTRKRVIAKFAAENLDIVRFMGEKELNDLLDRQLLKLISKLPDRIKAFIPSTLVHKVTDVLTSKLTDFLVERGHALIQRD